MIKRAALLFILLFGIVSQSWATFVTGHVTRAFTGDALSGVAVTALNTNDGTTYYAITDAAGGYTLPSNNVLLTLGLYSVTFSLTGYVIDSMSVFYDPDRGVSIV